MSAQQVLDQVPESRAIADIDPYHFDMERTDVGADTIWLELKKLIAQLWASDTYDGIIVGHGTNHLEETAYFLHLTLPADVNVVVFGAMRAANALSTDADVAFLEAVEVAVAAGDAPRGVVVVMSHEVFDSESVMKLWTTRVDAFTSLYRGPMGLVQSHDGVRWLMPPSQRHGTRFAVERIARLPRVDLVLSHAEADGAIVAGLVERGTRGLVSAAAGAGRPTNLEESAMKEARASGVVVCQASRVPGAYVARTERLRQLGFVAAGWLSPWKARILLSLALVQTSDPLEIQEIFAFENGKSRTD